MMLVGLPFPDGITVGMTLSFDDIEQIRQGRALVITGADLKRIGVHGVKEWGIGATETNQQAVDIIEAGLDPRIKLNKFWRTNG